jgi:ATP/maltotriose-dependent transcriptional regulator MalT
VSRPRLFGRLGTARVIVVSAPAGSGKTVLQSWIRQAGLAGCAAWVPVGRGQRDPQRFWRHARLEGTTADVGPMSGQIALSLLRADHVRAVLISLGALPAQITTTGVGSDFPQFTSDRNAAGTLLAGPATLNRSVRITLG